MYFHWRPYKWHKWPGISWFLRTVLGGIINIVHVFWRAWYLILLMVQKSGDHQLIYGKYPIICRVSSSLRCLAFGFLNHQQYLFKLGFTLFHFMAQEVGSFMNLSGIERRQQFVWKSWRGIYRDWLVDLVLSCKYFIFNLLHPIGPANSSILFFKPGPSYNYKLT